jgi:hypothetical protein
MPVKTTKPLTRDQRLAYQLALAFKKFIDPAIGFLDIRLAPEGTEVGQFSSTFSVPARPDPGELRSLRVAVYRNEVRLYFRRGEWARSATFDAADLDFERDLAEFIGKHWGCYFSTYWMSV